LHPRNALRQARTMTRGRRRQVQRTLGSCHTRLDLSSPSRPVLRSRCIAVVRIRRVLVLPATCTRRVLEVADGERQVRNASPPGSNKKPEWVAAFRSEMVIKAERCQVYPKLSLIRLQELDGIVAIHARVLLEPGRAGDARQGIALLARQERSEAGEEIIRLCGGGMLHSMRVTVSP